MAPSLLALAAVLLACLCPTVPAPCAVPHAILTPSTVLYNSVLNITHLTPGGGLVRFGGAACTVAYGLSMDQPLVSQVAAADGLFWQYGAWGLSTLFGCGYVQAVHCTQPVVAGITNTRGQTQKSEMLATGPLAPSVPIVLTPVVPASGQAFTARVSGSWAALTSVAFGLSLGDCDTFVHRWNTTSTANLTRTATQITLTVPATAVPGPATFAAYALCIRLHMAAVGVGGWFSAARFAGHSNHHIFVGNSTAIALHTATAGVAWSIANATVLYNTTAYLRAPLRLDTPFDLFLTAGVAAGRSWTRYALDASQHLCHPRLNASFLASSVVAHNATHDVVHGVTVATPPTQPGGGYAVLCGSLGAGQPWVLVSPAWYLFSACGYGEIASDRTGNCNACGPTAESPCNNRGTCTYLIDEARQSPISGCECDRGYTGDYCERRISDTLSFSAPRASSSSSASGTPTASASDSVTASHSVSPSASRPASLSLSPSVPPNTLSRNVTNSRSGLLTRSAAALSATGTASVSDNATRSAAVSASPTSPAPPTTLPVVWVPLRRRWPLTGPALRWIADDSDSNGSVGDGGGVVVARVGRGTRRLRLVSSGPGGLDVVVALAAAVWTALAVAAVVL